MSLCDRRMLLEAMVRSTTFTLLGLLLGSWAARAQPPLAVAPLFDLPSPNGCAGETMTMRQDAVGAVLYVAARTTGCASTPLVARVVRPSR